MHPHLSDVLVSAVYHGEICEEHAEVRYHSLHRATLEGGGRIFGVQLVGIYSIMKNRTNKKQLTNCFSNISDDNLLIVVGQKSGKSLELAS